jgi:hypothetical protein
MFHGEQTHEVEDLKGKRKALIQNGSKGPSKVME